MKPVNYEDLFLDYIDDTLDEPAKRELEATLAADPTLRRSYERYQAVVSTERSIGGQEFEPNPGFTSTVMRRVEKRGGFLERLAMVIAMNRKVAASLLATTAVAVIVVRSAQDTSQVYLNPGSINPAATTEQTATGPVVPAPLTAPAQVAPGGTTAGASALPFGVLTLGKSATAPSGGVESYAQNGASRRHIPNAKGAGELIGKAIGGEMPPSSGVGAIALPGEYLPPFIPPAQSADRYLGHADSAPILVTQEAVSTFSIDVDTASYTNTRRFIEAGQLPPRNAVRTEEFINYFDYAYPVQHERPFTLSYEIAPSPLSDGRTLLKLGIKAKDVAVNRQPWNLVFLIDTSGSMAADNKLPLVKKALGVLVDKMRPDDRVSIVTYAGSSEVKLGATTGADKARISAVIEGLHTGGGTHGAGGIQAAYALAGANKAPGVNRVVLVTDGDFNVGVTSHDELVRMIEHHRRSGVALTTIGVGSGNLNDALLEQLANKGDGNYFYLDSFREARRVFEDKIAGTIETVAKDVKLQMEFNPQHVVQYKLIGYENRLLAKQDFNNDAVDAGEVGAGHTVTALYELVLAGSSAATTLIDASRYQQAPTPRPVETNEKLAAELGFLKIRFKAPEGANSQLVEFPIAMRDVRNDIAAASPDFRFAAAIAGFGQSLRGALPAAETIEQLIPLAESGVGFDPRGDRREAIELMKSARSLAAQSVSTGPIAPHKWGVGLER